MPPFGFCFFYAFYGAPERERGSEGLVDVDEFRGAPFRCTNCSPLATPPVFVLPAVEARKIEDNPLKKNLSAPLIQFTFSCAITLGRYWMCTGNFL